MTSSRNTAPTGPDWAWLGKLTLQELAFHGTDPTDMPWLHRVWCWLHQRLEPGLREGQPDPLPGTTPLPMPDELAPVLAVTPGGDASHLAFIEVLGSSAEDGAPDSSLGIQEAMDHAHRLLQGANPETPVPHARVHYSGRLSGRSAGGASFIHALRWALDLTADHESVTTACWKEGQLFPVEPDLMPAKVALARRWGFRELLVVEDQQGVPVDTGELEIKFLPVAPRQALATILERLPVEEESAILQLLLAIDLALVHGDLQFRDLSRVLDSTEPLVKPGMSTLIRHVAHDLRSRSYLHAGKSLDSARERDRARENTPKVLPEGWLGNYLQWEQHASHSIIALDLGEWEEEYPDHARLDEEIELLSKKEPQPMREFAARLKLRNTRAKRWDFQGRLQDDIIRLEKAANEYLAEREFWEGVVDFDRKLGVHTTTLNRQHNSAMDPLLAIFDRTGSLPQLAVLEGRQFWPEEMRPEEISNCGFYDRPYAIRWLTALGIQLSDDVLAAALAAAEEEAGGKPATYPTTLTAEAILRTKIGSVALRLRAAEFLATCALVQEVQDPIQALLGIRAAALCTLEGLPVEPTWTGEMGNVGWVVSAMGSDPLQQVRRCPY
jgi:hypothetical protein